jgi:hypothetical protein
VPPATAAPTKLLVDGHVHFHDCFAWEDFLNAAARNFARARATLGLTSDSPGCLMFAESTNVNQFRDVREQPALMRSAGWQVERGSDDCALTLNRGTGETIVVVAGRQIATAEHLEVLALGCADEMPDGRPVRDVIRDVTDRGSLPAIPWGFGKWWGRRGRLVRRLVEDDTLPPFCLADNGGRARAQPRPPLLAWAERHGMVVLAGTDPLPLPRQVGRAGSFGFILDGWQTTAAPTAAIRSGIQTLQGSPLRFGDLSGLLQLAHAQLGLWWQSRRTNNERRQ